jgi:hypothetical protein
LRIPDTTTKKRNQLACKDTSTSPNSNTSSQSLFTTKSLTPKKKAKLLDSSPSLKELWKSNEVEKLVLEVANYTDKNGKINWVALSTDHFPKKTPSAVSSKYNKWKRNQPNHMQKKQSNTNSSENATTNSASETADHNSMNLKNLPEANEILNQIKTILNSQGLSNEQLLHLIQSEVHKATYAGFKIKKHFKGKGDFIGDIVGFDGAVYTVVYADGDVETYSEAEIKKLML